MYHNYLNSKPIFTMTRIITSVLTSFLLVFSFVAQPALASSGEEAAAGVDHHERMVWDIDNNHSNILFKINHFFNEIPGTFHNFGGEVVFDPENAENSEFDIEIIVASVDTNVQDRDSHLRTDDFFDVQSYPTMHFRSTEVRHVEGSDYVAHGQLRIKDVTREVELPFEFLGVREHLMRDNVLVAGLNGNLTINRTDFGVGVGDFASTAVIGDEVNIQITLQVHKEVSS